ncbi:hypothetical protein CHS0354_013705 [Potamilus streckersoni]|uniref:Sorting nexin n=1 Tax=Potamilus streckersoni TaxID=2493646 RepID=A0AAE0SZ46_9BIVA|nr:hypothetical protein CHS0354_013705 [Potamilus streckersoni]
MAEILAKALYNFDADVSAGELNFRAGDVLIIVNQDIGDGWWEARDGSHNTGLIPQAYVQLVDPPEPSFPPPPPPMASAPYKENYPYNGYGYQDSGGGRPGVLQHQQQSAEDWDDDWDDDDDDGSSASTGAGSSGAGSIQQELQGGGNFGLSQPNRDSKASISPPSDVSKYGTVKKSFSRFSTFAKAGGDAFLSGQISGNVPESDQIHILDSVDGPVWKPIDSPYTCTISSPKKESKLKGLKSFIAYQLRPSFTNIQVSRRYKHFDWLLLRLEEKFTCIPIPPLPDKAISGRYEEDFIEHRRKQLQRWMNRMVQHPVISQSDVFVHFLTCTDDKKWKQGKRKAEKDEYLGMKFFLTLNTPPNALSMGEVDGRMETFCKFVKNMDDNVRSLLNVCQDNRKKQQNHFKREYKKFGDGFKSLAATFSLDHSHGSRELTSAIEFTGETYNQIGDMFEKQPVKDLEPMMDELFEYKGVLSAFPEVLKLHEGTIGKAKECQRLQQEGKMAESEVQSQLQRADVVSFGTLAEINHFQKERVREYKAMMQNYLTEQISFYSEVCLCPK